MKETQDMLVVAPVNKIEVASMSALQNANSDFLLDYAYADRIFQGANVDHSRKRNTQQSREWQVSAGAAGVCIGRKKVTVTNEEVIFRHLR